MTVREIMVSKPACCQPEADLAVATALLCNHNCGALPVVDAKNQPVGMITDRDICIALGTRDKRAAEISVSQVMSGKVFACDAGSDIRKALDRMKKNHVRRLIVTEYGELKGMLSIDDIVLNIQWSDHSEVELSFLDVIRVLRQVTYPVLASETACANRSLAPQTLRRNGQKRRHIRLAES